MPRPAMLALAALALVVGCHAQGQPLREHGAPYAFSPTGAPVAAPPGGAMTAPMAGGMPGGMMAAHHPRRALRQAFAGAGLPGPGFDPFSFVANSMRYGPGAAFGFPAAPGTLVDAADLGEGAPAAPAAAASAPSAAPPSLAEAPSPSPAPAAAPASAPAPSPAVSVVPI